MKTAGPEILLRVLRNPEILTDLNILEWDLLIRVARRNKLLARLGFLIERLEIADRCPPRALGNIRSAQVYVDHYQFLIHRELKEVRKALSEIEAPILLLKGAAYLIAGLPPTHGRLLSDLDILTPRVSIPIIEQRLKTKGWISKTTDDYDQRYYREWMHEIPPLAHRKRSVEVDIHHNLLPLTGRLRIDSELLWQQACQIPGTRLFTLSAADMVLHSAAHLFVSDELRGGLRDLVDISELCGHFSALDDDYYQRLLARAQELGLSRPLYYALYCLGRLLHVQLPEQMSDRANFDLPDPITRRLMQGLITRVLTPHHPEKKGAPISKWLLYVRSHWIRMPPGMLTMHLLRKWLRRNASKTD